MQSFTESEISLFPKLDLPKEWINMRDESKINQQVCYEFFSSCIGLDVCCHFFFNGLWYTPLLLVC